MFTVFNLLKRSFKKIMGATSRDIDKYYRYLYALDCNREKKILEVQEFVVCY